MAQPKQKNVDYLLEKIYNTKKTLNLSHITLWLQLLLSSDFLWIRMYPMFHYTVAQHLDF